MELKIGDICVNAPEFTSGCWLIVDVDEQDVRFPYRVIHLVNKKMYSFGEEGLVKIGQLAVDMSLEQVRTLLSAVPPLPSVESEEYELGRLRAEYLAKATDGLTRKRWEVLARAKPGDLLLIGGRKRPEIVTFHHVLERGEKYVFLAANRTGKLYRYPLDALPVGEAPAGTGVL
jgi:hypothetical protein